MRAHNPYLASLGLVFGLAAAATAQEDPVFQGPPIHEGAWKVEAKWSDPAAGANDHSKGSFAYHYRVWAKQRSDKHVKDRTKLDCADLSIALLCEYAALNKLPLSWRVFHAPKRRFVTIHASDKQFASPEAFSRWSQWFLGAMNLADNTYAITYDEWAGGDMVLMDWNQSEESPNFGEREVWHTYLIGVPDKVIYYGNISNGNALAVTRVTSGSRMKMVREHPDRHGYSPRRFRLFKDALWPPRENPPRQVAEVIRVSSQLNLRKGPGTSHAVVKRAKRGQSFTVLERKGRWVRLELPGGETVWAHGFYLKITQLAEGNGGGLTGGLEPGS